MYTVSSDKLSIHILDPVTDRDRFGLRFCTGGYIFQVENTHGDELLSGPTYPYDFVPVHGQGAPDTFNHIPLRIQGSDDVMILGIGRCNMESDSIVEPCLWKIEKISDSRISFSTRHAFDSYDIYLKRTVSLSSFKVIVETEIKNSGSVYLPISWYPHPFFPPAKDNVLFSLPETSMMDVPTGFFKQEGRLFKRVQGISQDVSFQPLRTHSDCLDAYIFTSKGYRCHMKSDYYSDFTPIWANDNTCSVEPYYDTTVFPSRKLSWCVSYEFEFDEMP